MPLERWLWRSYLRSAILPLLFIEITFLCIYLISNALVYKENVSAVSTVSNQFLQDVARREAMSVGNGLSGVSQSTRLYASRTLAALKANYVPPSEERARYAMAPGGAFYTTRDNGTTASFYSGARPVGPQEIDKVWRLSALDPLMIDIARSNRAISSIYFNSWDSYNRIYPYFDVLKQYPPKMDIPSYNFYYEADGGHNPQRDAVWTDAYIDPAGHGWMVSSVAPVWNGDKLEGVVGIDLTLSTVIDRLMNIDLPWHAYALLVDRQGRIIAMPPAGERDLGLSELTTHRYSDAILEDTFKPDGFNIRKRSDTAALVRAMEHATDGEALLKLKGRDQIATFSKIAGPDWWLVIIAPTSNIYAHANGLRDRVQAVGYVMIVGLVLFYALFFVFLYRRAQSMSASVARPVKAISALIERIGGGTYRQSFPGSRVQELDDLGRRLVVMGNSLGDAHERIIQQERVVSHALARQRQVNEEQARFIAIMSHELRTPLSIIDSGAQILDRRADAIEPADIRQRAGKMRRAVARISDLLHRLVHSTSAALDGRDEGTRPASLRALIEDVACEMVPRQRLQLDIAALPGDATVTDGAALAVALRAVLDNAVRYTGDAPVSVLVGDLAAQVRVVIRDEGPGIPENDRTHVTERFFRGHNAVGIEGAGIGLPVAERLVTSLGGTLSVEFRENGTDVVLQVPVTLARPVSGTSQSCEQA